MYSLKRANSKIIEFNLKKLEVISQQDFAKKQYALIAKKHFSIDIAAYIRSKKKISVK